MGACDLNPALPDCSVVAFAGVYGVSVIIMC
jgi:hypothetical protein